ncbi:MAG: hemolysin III family protein [Pseudomonadota bacterium]
MYFPTYTFREKVADALVHAIGVLACIIGVSILMVMTALNGNNDAMIAGAIFGCGMLASFTMSAAYNIIEIKDWKAVLKRADHAAIYLMIAGAYTPIAAVVIGGEVGWSLLAFVWTLALLGVFMNIALPEKFKKAPVALYLLIGWALIGAADSFVTNMSELGLYLMAGCAALYMSGVFFFKWESLPFQNAIWHIFVLVASGFLYAAIYVELTTR